MFLPFFLHSDIMNKAYVLNVLNYEALSVTVCVRLVAHARLLKKKSNPRYFILIPRCLFMWCWSSPKLKGVSNYRDSFGAVQ